ncbi:proteasome-activating nucleotidase [Staphylothermus hellenicus]|uniref:Proteasome-activating nucleotidase n=1 Tax=Staphylothermus hellenicus (strain DSM 12710 / JCM 10830 / BK20S6-10-b1 / P8) TaxID=591019 RepID=D7DA43_STAHD|nr:proteasome-activating nucleotidase [Staphylothermus hellenicus]ADI32639.1 26S proteasome subunit P45 family [Staphylothermus hellenicus DSM 12710]
MSSDAKKVFKAEIDEEEYVRLLESKIRFLESERDKLMMKIRFYKSEIEKLLSPPLIEAIVVNVLKNGKVVVKSSTGPNLVVKVLSSIPLEKLRPGQHVALNNRGSTIVDVLPEHEDPYVKSMEVIDRPSVTFEDIGGLKEQVRELREVVELPLKNPELFEEIGIEPPKGVLLYGPPGCGKTLLAKAVAHESGATFISIVGSELVQKFIGEGARIVREVFQYARKKAPAIVFIDEIDAIAARRLDIGTSGEREVQRTLMQLLAEIDGFKPLDKVKIIAATNRIDILDPAILRPGRFDRLIEVPLPDLNGRYEIFKVHTRKMKLGRDVDLYELARLTEGATGAEIKSIVTEAGYNAIRNNRRQVIREDFIYAIKKVMSKKKIRDKNAEYLMDRSEKDYSRYMLQ